MKAIIIAVVVGAVVVGMFTLNERKTEVINPQPEVITEEVRVSELDARIKEAQDMARSEVEAKAHEAYQAAYDHEMLEIELAVTSEYRAEIETREAELAEQSVAY